MQTFLPFADFKKSAECLDMKRLGKQRVEAYTILKILLGLTKSNAWKNHPAVKMWSGYECVLYKYILDICDEWMRRGYKDTIKEKTTKLANEKDMRWYGDFPDWLGDPEFHKSHMSNLIRKNKQHYSKYFNIQDDLPYYWPVK